jgi:hypothetical protein
MSRGVMRTSRPTGWVLLKPDCTIRWQRDDRKEGTGSMVQPTAPAEPWCRAARTTTALSGAFCWLPPPRSW